MIAPKFLLPLALAILPAVASAQIPTDTAAKPDTALVSPAPAAPAVPDAIRRSWEAPFAVESSGRPPARGPRSVVILRDTTRARAVPPVAAAAKAPAASTPTASSRPRTPAPASSPAAAGTVTHRIEWGETWYGIAREYGVSSRDLAAANPGVNPDHLISGEVLRIPRGASKAVARRTHTVADGETLWAIARRYGVGTEALRRANHLTGTRVRVGQTLIIPQEERR
jgi:LysM repeat protein